ncbi:MAG TPA: hypothetical protein VKA84_09870, partial [Gemmatimonadaceae bacterium]|nr:hypothetical protein [Gemmatimonadaceae bacterium]
LDVLAQTLVAAVAVDDWAADALYALVRRAYPYHRLTRAAFDGVLEMLAGKYPSELAAELQPRLSWDRATGRLSPLPGSRLTAVLNGGTIPDRGLYAVQLPDRTRLGELDEEFVHESRVGDVFQLGSSTWRVAAIEHDRVVVHPAPGAPARMPFWHGEFMARSPALAARVGELRRALAAATTRDALREIAARYRCDEATAQSLAEYVQQQRAVTGVVPDDRTLLLEHFRDETGAWRVVLHAPFGGRVSAPWGMALAARAREALGATAEVQVQTSDDGVMLRFPDLGGDPPLGALLDLTPSEAETRVAEAVGETSLFGARFRMNAARALLLPRGSARRRMPLWLQRLKALDLLDAVREFPDFPVLVETYRDVLQDAFDMPALREVLSDLVAGRTRVQVVRTELPSPFAASLQFGFTIDWLYADDTPRAERQAARLAVDRALLDEVMGSGDGEDDAELRRAIEQTVAERQGTAPGRRARTADELAVLLDRAGDLSPAELRARVATAEEGVRGDPVADLLAGGRVVAVGIAEAEAEPGVPARGGEGSGERSGGSGSGSDRDSDNLGGPPPDSEATLRDRRNQHPSSAPRGESSRTRARGGPPQIHDTAPAAGERHRSVAWRIILTESYPRYAAAFGDALLSRVRAGAELAERDAADVVPDVLLRPVVTPEAARREVLARFVALAGPLTAGRIAARYGWGRERVQRWLDERHRVGKLVRGRFSAPTPGGRVAAIEYCSRRVVEIARRRALAALRRSIAAVPMSAYASFLQKWQGLDPGERQRERQRGGGGRALADVLRQLYGLPRPGAAWERDYLPARLDRYDPAELSRLMAAGEVVWAGVGRRDDATGALALAQLRFVARGAGAVWREAAPGEGDAATGAGDAAAAAASLSEAGRAVYDALARFGASFYADLQAATGLGGVGLREALRELAAAGLATSDAVESMREVVRLRPLPPRGPAAPDPTRWLPEGFTPSPGRPVVRRRPNLRRLPKWKRPDREPPAGGVGGGAAPLPPGAPWPGRWSRLDTPGVLGPPLTEEARAEAVARQWLARYGVVSRDWWRRERPPVSWRLIYHELRRLELRGEVRRGYFVRGLAGAQFALPEAVERLREPPDEDAPFLVMAAGDPANPYALPRPRQAPPAAGAPNDAAGAAAPADDDGGGGPASRPRGLGALLVTRNGRVVLGVEGRGRNVMVAPGTGASDVTGAARALADFLLAAGASPGTQRRGDAIVRRIDGRAAVGSPHAEAFAQAGFRRAGTELRYYAGIGSRSR